MSIFNCNKAACSARFDCPEYNSSCLRYFARVTAMSYFLKLKDYEQTRRTAKDVFSAFQLPSELEEEFIKQFLYFSDIPW